MRIALVVGLAALTVGLGFYAYRYSIRPVTLTVAAGSLDGEGARLMNALASRLASTANSRIRLKVIDTGTPLGAAEAFSKGEADLAIVRGDATDLKRRTHRGGDHPRGADAARFARHFDH